jgi:hypothetical protein
LNISYLDLLITLFALVRGCTGCNNRTKKNRESACVGSNAKSMPSADRHLLWLACESLLATSLIRVSPVAAGIMI